MFSRKVRCSVSEGFRGGWQIRKAVSILGFITLIAGFCVEQQMVSKQIKQLLLTTVTVSMLVRMAEHNVMAHFTQRLPVRNMVGLLS